MHADQEHQRILNEYEKCNDDILNLNNEKKQLKEQINKILIKMGFNIQKPQLESRTT